MDPEKIFTDLLGKLTSLPMLGAPLTCDQRNEIFTVFLLMKVQSSMRAAFLLSRSLISFHKGSVFRLKMCAFFLRRSLRNLTPVRFFGLPAGNCSGEFGAPDGAPFLFRLFHSSVVEIGVMEVVARSLEDTRRFAGDVVDALRGCGWVGERAVVVGLSGELGAGEGRRW